MEGPAEDLSRDWAEEGTSSLPEQEAAQDGGFMYSNICHFSRNNLAYEQDLCVESIDDSSGGEEVSADDSTDSRDSDERSNIVPLSRSIASTDIREEATEEIGHSGEKEELGRSGTAGQSDLVPEAPDSPEVLRDGEPRDASALVCSFGGDSEDGKA
ncbi:uncharacterized protein LOC144299269 isoform X3 [Canis aureus]